ncbi:ABC transporter ATP-binding protein [Planotetraspora kaengkrachanensis]|uniref:HlyB/MsbA family ABC transporter n=1 Tax=Planotetraspora kaengkrachanensis TaxID=575193 RepID=A0A8J3LUM9_9ACTN|nr:ABC transporter ATP-binding protein [Planotetraspora kaengkrachanensis]GIG79077.1 HlyB/MsbA family ABC transporter [Planotetraspora kaengkrachanensis]
MRPLSLVVARLVRNDLRRYLVGGLLWLPVSVIPLGSGLLLQQIFDRIGGDRVAGPDQILWLCAAFVGVEVARSLIMYVANLYGGYWWDAMATLLRANVLRSLLTAPGPAAGRQPHSPGESVARLRDDVSDLVELVDESVPLAGTFLFSGAALAIMATVDPVITLVLIVPMIVAGLLSRLMSAVVRRLHSRARGLGAAVTAFIGETFGGVLAIKTTGAEDAVLERLRAHNRSRRDAAVKDRLAADLLETSTSATVEISIGLVLLLAAPAMRRGDFTVGDLALFTSYVGWLTALPRIVGRVLFRLPQAAVSTERLTRLMAPHEDADHLSRNSGVWFHREPPRPPGSVPAHDDPLEVLEARGLTVRHDESGRGVHGIDLVIRRGSFTVVTGAVGSGKTTLVRALLGLARADAGTVLWNGRPVADPGTFLVPGRAAYASQVPRLLSESLRENLLLGRSGDDADLARALESAAFEEDLAEMPDGLDTVVGPRGVRLSGGQAQRATAARALVRMPDLLVVDDLSSALDVETEKLLWDRIAGAARDGRGPATLLVVSHRQAALERADQVVVLDRGRVAGRGTLGDVLETCPEMRRLWHEERVVEAEESPVPPGG